MREVGKIISHFCGRRSIDKKRAIDSLRSASEVVSVAIGCGVSIVSSRCQIILF